MNKDDLEACHRLLHGRVNPDEFMAGYAAACADKQPTIENLLTITDLAVSRATQMTKKYELELKLRNILIQGLEDVGSGKCENYIKTAWTAVTNYWRSKKENNSHD